MGCPTPGGRGGEGRASEVRGRGGRGKEVANVTIYVERDHVTSLDMQ